LILSLIAAMARNGVIGRDNQLPWRMPADLKRFKQLTTGHVVIMGRRTFASLNSTPLPDRHNIVITRQRDYHAIGAQIAHNFDDALKHAAAHHPDAVFILGGAEIFAIALPLAQRMHLTVIDADIEGDTVFPDFDRSQWHLIGEEAHAADERHQFPYRFQEWART
jgi:dihydrofolate reductase